MVHDDCGLGEDVSDFSDDCDFNAPEVPYSHTRLDIESWQDAWSEELVTAYHVVTDLCRQNGWAILDGCTYHDFATWAYDKSRGCPNV
jgi:hypothetical protein